MNTKEAAYSKISELVERFSYQIDSYKKSDYNEALVRKDFIDLFFRALGWDMNNSQGYAEAYREVIHEDKLKIGGATKAPDYSFRLPGGKRLFFVEAKKPSVLVKEDVAPAYQLRRYGWNAKLPISLITDFEEFAVYDCTKKPGPADKASKARIKYITYKQYLDEFDFIWNTFSKSSVLKGSFDKFVVSDTNKKGTATVDKEFLASLDEWRIMLAQNIALRNQQLNEDELNFVVQQTIDRIIFLRIAEDRSVEPYGELKKITDVRKEEGEYFKSLFTLFKEADSKYNSGLFDFKKDTLSKNISLDNKVIKTIVSELYYPNCPYEFSVLGVEILGSAYEQFLGKQIKLSPGHKAIIEEKPEVRKAGGVYYTPQYIVDYIVANTVGKKASPNPSKGGGRVTPEEIAKLKIVDPACGSGSFLIGAYSYLLNWHLEYYKPQFIQLSEKATDNNSPRKAREDAIKQRNKLPLTPDGNLTTHLKKEILLNNIYGVDIDTQAVEVTKLSLLLKCMEGETGSSINAVMRFGERVLPTLDNNIKSGNSLIDMDFYDGVLDFEPGIEKKVKPFSWQNAFPEVFKEGGFDCVIGNPPYVRIQSIAENSPAQGEYFSKQYKAASKGNYDLYVVFVEKTLALINNDGNVSFILPHKFFTAQYGTPLRDLLQNKKAIDQIVHFGHQQVFENATTYTCIITLDKRDKKSFEFAKVEDLEEWRNSAKNEYGKIEYKDIVNDEWNFVTGDEQKVYNHLRKINVKLEDVTERIFQGLKTGADKIFIVNKIRETKSHYQVYSSETKSEFSLEKDLLHPLIKGGDSRGYLFSNSNLLIIFPYKQYTSGKTSLILESELKEKFPNIYSYLRVQKTLLLSRDGGKIEINNWYGYSRNQALDIISTPKIFTPDIAPEASYAIDTIGNIFFTGGVAGGYGIKLKDNISELYLLGLLNSKLLDWYLKQISTQMRGGWYSYEAKYIKHIPIVLKDKGNEQSYNEIISLVKTMLLLQKEKQETRTPDKLNQLEARIKYTNDKINQLVFDLYGLSEEEIKIVNGK